MSDTSAIDEKKQEMNQSPSTFTSKIVGFVYSVIVIFVIILLYFCSGGLMLYLCKLAQSNILPTDSNCAPYTDSKPNIEQIQSNIFTTYTNPETSMKIQFPYDKNSDDKIIDMFKKYKEKSSSNFLANYFISITELLLEFNYSSMNTIMNFMNETFFESIIIFLGPIIGSFLYVIGLIINHVYFIFLWFYSMSWFFKHNSNDSGDGLPQWEDVTLFTPIDWWLGAGLAILFTILLFLAFPILTFIPICAYHNSLLSSIFYKSIMNNKPSSIFTVISGVLKYYKISVVSTISFFVILLSFSNLGVVPGIFSILTLMMIYWGVISLNIFKPIQENNLSESVSYKQAKKTCSKSSIKEKHGFLYDLFLGQNGGSIANEIKKVGKKLSK
jgi:hypothetical protein